MHGQSLCQCSSCRPKVPLEGKAASLQLIHCISPDCLAACWQETAAEYTQPAPDLLLHPWAHRDKSQQPFTREKKKGCQAALARKKSSVTIQRGELPQSQV